MQKEAYLAGVQCVTLRDTTEWVETLNTGWNVLVDLDAEAAQRALETPPPEERPQLYGDGRAGERVVAALTAVPIRLISSAAQASRSTTPRPSTTRVAPPTSAGQVAVLRVVGLDDREIGGAAVPRREAVGLAAPPR